MYTIRWVNRRALPEVIHVHALCDMMLLYMLTHHGVGGRVESVVVG